MTAAEYKDITRAVVLALREELTLDNKDVVEKLSEIDNKLNYDGKALEESISAEPGNNLCRMKDGLYARNTYVTTESSPVGEIIAFMGTTAPDHYLSCDGTEYSIGNYPLLESFFIEQFGSVNYFGGDGINTFAVPDLRGEFLRGTGANSHENQGNGSSVGVHQDGTEQSSLNIWGNNRLGIITINPNLPFKLYSQADKEISAINASERRFESYNISSNSGSLAYGYTSRPTNTSVMYCIKYEPTCVVETEFLASKPHLWPEDTEVDLGNGLYGIRKTGTITAAAKTNNTIHLAIGKNIINCGGWWSNGADAESYFNIGQSYTPTTGTYESCVSYQPITSDIRLSTKSAVSRNNAGYMVWVTYTKE